MAQALLYICKMIETYARIRRCSLVAVAALAAQLVRPQGSYSLHYGTKRSGRWRKGRH